MDRHGPPAIASTSVNRLMPEDALEAGLRIGTIFRTVGLASDADPCSVPIAAAFIAGVNASGSDVLFAESCPVPAALFSLKNSCQCIVAIGCPSVTGMPAITFYHNDGSTFSEVDLRVLEDEPDSLPDWSGIGRMIRIRGAPEEYIDALSRSGLKIEGYVVLDCGCGSTSSVAPASLASLGAYVTTVNADPRSSKPRNPEAAKTDLLTLSNFVNASTGSIGIAYNGDGTRVSVTTEGGLFIPYDRLLALFLMYIEPRVAVIPFDAPAMVEDAFWKPYGYRTDGHGSEPDRKILRGTSDAEIFELCKANNADFAALGNGKFVFPETSLCPDGILASAYISELSGTRAVGRLHAEIPTYISKHISLPYSGTSHMFDKKFIEAISRCDKKDFAVARNAWKVIKNEGMYTVMLVDKNIVVDAVANDELYLATMVDEAVSLIKSCFRRVCLCTVGVIEIKMNLLTRGIVYSPARSVIRQTCDEMDSAHIAEHLEVVVGCLCGISRMGMRGPRTFEIDGGHPIAEKAVRIPEYRARKHYEFIHYPVVGPMLAYKFIRICGPGGFVEGIYKIHADSPYLHMLFTSFSRTLE